MPPTAGSCGCATSSREADGGLAAGGWSASRSTSPPRRKEQADKRRIAQLYEALIENSSDNISLLRPDGITVYQSQAVQPQLGYDASELVGRNNFDLVHPDDVGRIQEQFDQLFGSDAVIGPVRYRFRHKDGTGAAWNRWRSATTRRGPRRSPSSIRAT